MPNNQTINIDDIAVIGERVPVGSDYIARLTSVEGKQSKNDKPCVYATFEITKGEHEGKETTCFFPLTVSKGKDGRTYASGIVEMKRVFAAVGKPLAKNYPFPLDSQEAARLFHKTVGTGKVKLAVIAEPDRTGATDDNGNVRVYFRTRILGTADVNEPHARATAAAVADEYGD